eukprot:3911970-Amphidinium_carterae.1
MTVTGGMFKYAVLPTQPATCWLADRIKIVPPHLHLCMLTDWIKHASMYMHDLSDLGLIMAANKFNISVAAPPLSQWPKSCTRLTTSLRTAVHLTCNWESGSQHLAFYQDLCYQLADYQ